MKNMKKFALGYFDRGFYVIPLAPNSKRPLVKFADKTFPREELEEFWDKEPNCNIGLLTRDFFVIDIDVHDTNGYKSLANWEHVKKIPRTSQVISASGGKHLYFKKPVGFTMPQKIAFLEGVDIKAHVNNYVVAPPSAIDGSSYKWDMEKSLKNLEITVATDELIKAIKETAGIEEKPQNYYTGALSCFKGDGPRISKVTQAVNECLKGLGGEGARNNTVASYVGKLIAMGIEKEIVVVLTNIMNDKSLKPLSAKELHNTIESMYNTDRRYNG